MSRGPGKVQRDLLALLAQQKTMVRLRGRTRSETVSLIRAARALEKAGKCVVIHLWDDDAPRRCISLWAFPPEMTVKGRPVQELSVARVPIGTGTTFNWQGSVRDIARHVGVSKSQAARDVAEAEGRGKRKG
jgi:hypothetical protein